jgi:hypothetical protein
MAGRGTPAGVARASLLCATALLAGLTACGDELANGPSAGNPSGGGSSTAAPAAASSALTVLVDDSEGTVTTWLLTCDPVGGDHPEAEAACRALDRSGANALPPVPRGRLCTQVFEGPEVAAVSGTWKGQRVDSRFNLRNGCEVGRWKALTGLLPAVGG